MFAELVIIAVDTALLVALLKLAGNATVSWNLALALGLVLSLTAAGLSYGLAVIRDQGAWGVGLSAGLTLLVTAATISIFSKTKLSQAVLLGGLAVAVHFPVAMGLSWLIRC